MDARQRVGTPLVVMTMTVALSFGTQAQNPIKMLPALGAPVPQFVITHRTTDQTCTTNPPRREPCATIRLQGVSFTVAWDERTNLVTYLFSDDQKLVMDSELSVGGVCRLTPNMPSARYANWLVTRSWTDTMHRLSGEAIWSVLLEKKDSEHGIVRGFVQSSYVESHFIQAPLPEY